MKTKFLYSIFLITILINLLSYASNKTRGPQPVQERSENFIADMNPFFVGNLHLYTKQSINSPRISEFDLYFSPRTNSIFINTKLSIDVIQIDFSYAERKALYETAQKYLNDYENGLIIDEKPTSKNTLYKGNIPISWGVFGYTHSAITKYQINTEYLWIDKPYYRIRFETTEDEDDASSPAFNLYISPSQWNNILEMCDQAALEARCEQVVNEAMEF